MGVAFQLCRIKFHSCSQQSEWELHCSTARLEAVRITNRLCGSQYNLKKKFQKNVSCESVFIQIITINISDTLKG